MKNNYCIILAGGEGRRLWPCSRKYMPKQFIDFFGTGRTLLQQTYDRFAQFIPRENIFVSTFKDYENLVFEQLPEIPQDNVLIEPVQMSTSPAVAWASYHISSINPEANIVVSPADQHIVNTKRFEQQVHHALDFVANNNVFLAMGVPATMPNTAYGYIQMGEEVKDGELYRVKSFQEKPAQEYANLFVESGEFLWNTGLFMWNVQSMTKLMREVAPLVAERIEAAAGTVAKDENLALVRDYYPESLSSSIDLLILDTCQNVYVYQCDFGWADVGCWPELHKVMKKDVDGNVVLGKSKVFMSGSSNNIVSVSDKKAVIVNGLDGYLIAENDNVLVICPNDKPTTVRRLADEVMVKLGEKYL
ncbi:MAG: mannose-1-phosphate guanylyltransferase [Bacteroidaceae bacterium]|nr:mannose-1-phosphate guanylyltransferase [Bacteroidaceae bacterium]